MLCFPFVSLFSLSHIVEPMLLVGGGCLEKRGKVVVEESVRVTLRKITWTRYVLSGDFLLENEAHPFLSRLVSLVLDGVAVVPEVVSESVQELNQSASPLGTGPSGVNGGVVHGLGLCPLGGDQSFNKLEPSNSALLVESFNKQCIGSILELRNG